MKYFIFLFLLLSIQSKADDAKWKIRAREHFEIHKIKNSSSSSTYKGLTNTVNIWKEVPYKWALGFAFSPVLANTKFQSGNLDLGDRIHLVHFGIEAKYFLSRTLPSLFTRLGITNTILRSTNNTENLTGMSSYLGLGWEKAYDNFGLALELAIRFTDLNKSTKIQSLSPSIGFHFYPHL